MCIRPLFCSFVIAAFLTPSRAEEKPEEAAKAEPSKEAKDGEKKEDPAADKVTEHTLELPTGRIAYKASAGFLPVLTKEDGAKSVASVFHIAYTRTDAGDSAARPVTFCFNGGPGSSSVWLHLGSYGPRRVWFDDAGNPPNPPGRLVDNPQTLLDQTDLVFIDPVSTGFSRAEKGEDAKQFHGVSGDIQAVGEFIRLWLTRNQRWASPKFLSGESYGTTRAAGLAEHLMSRQGIEVNGLVLVSSVLDFQTIAAHDSNYMPYVLYLPTYTATALHHGLLKGDRAALLAKAEAYALDRYLPALARGGALAPDERARVARELSELTGIPPERILEQNLHLHPVWFMGELLRDQGRQVGRMDGRYTAPQIRAFGSPESFDPSLSSWIGPYTAAFNDYLRRELKYETDLPYEILSPKVHPWKWDGSENRYLALQEAVRSTVLRNPALRVFIASGDLDLATPYFATDFTFRQIDLPGVGLQWVHKRYPAGHMMYVHHDSLVRMRADLRAFYDETLKAAPAVRTR